MTNKEESPEGLFSESAILHVARLARLELTQDEVDTYGAQLRSIVGHVQDIANLEITDVPAAQNAIPLINVFREDIIEESLALADVLACAPSVEAERFRVPKVLGDAP